MTNYLVHAYNASEYKEENMKTIKLSEEEVETMSHTDVAYMILKENGKLVLRIIRGIQKHGLD